MLVRFRHTALHFAAVISTIYATANNTHVAGGTSVDSGYQPKTQDDSILRDPIDRSDAETAESSNYKDADRKSGQQDFYANDNLPRGPPLLPPRTRWLP